MTHEYRLLGFETARASEWAYWRLARSTVVAREEANQASNHDDKEEPAEASVSSHWCASAVPTVGRPFCCWMWEVGDYV